MNFRNEWEATLKMANEDLKKYGMKVRVLEDPDEGTYSCDIHDGFEWVNFADNYYERELGELVNDAWSHARAKTMEKMEWTYVDGIEFCMTAEDARMCSHMGQCDDDCEAARNIPYIRKQLDKLRCKDMEAAIREYGVEFEEYKGKRVPRATLELYVVWLAAGNIVDELYEQEKAAA